MERVCNSKYTEQFIAFNFQIYYASNKKGKTMSNHFLFKARSALLPLMLLGAASSFLQADLYKHTTQSLSVYGWLPSMDGSLKYKIPGIGTSDPDSQVESNLADTLDSVFMGSYEIRNNGWVLLGDMVYLKMSAEQSATISTPRLKNIPDITIASEQELTAKLFGLYGGHNLIEKDHFTFDIMGGVRYFSIGVDLSFSVNDMNKEYSPSIEKYDAVVGFKGAYAINEDWFIPYSADIGTGDSEYTWQAAVSAGYKFNWGDVLLTYRYLHYDFGEDSFVNEFDLYGPKIGAVIHF